MKKKIFLKLYPINVELKWFSVLSQHDAQRKRLGVVGKFEFRQPIAEADNCNIADILL